MAGAAADGSGGLRAELDRRLSAHLAHFLGAWPPAGPVTVVASRLREEPGWDGRIRPVFGITTPGGALVSVSPAHLEAAAALAAADGLEGLVEGLGAIHGEEGVTLRQGVFRYCQSLVAAEAFGTWLPPEDPRLPEWLRPFNGEVVVALDESGAYRAGVGRKRHDDFAQELAVHTDPGHRRNGLARRLVAEAARRVFEEGAVATYLHRPDNLASAAVARAAGFPDISWGVLGLPGGG